MDAPPIQYAKTADGVSIAFWTLGDGPPLVMLPNPVISNIQIEWELDFRRNTYERLAERATVIRYDWRGLGVSQRDCLDLSPEAASRDLEAVVQSLGLDRFAVYGARATPVAFVYPGQHPDLVSHLIVGVSAPPRHSLRNIEVIQTLADQDWGMLSEFWARVNSGWDNPVAGQIAAWLRGTTDTPSDTLAALDAAVAFSPEAFLTAIKAPTLILHPRDSEGASRFARSLAAGIAGAHLMGIPGWPFGFNINETIVNAVLDFINTAPASPGAPIAPPQVDISAVRTIVFTDVEGSTALNERLGDEGARKVLREHERLTREALGAHGGSEVKAMGDGFMVWFPSATRAVECAIALQKAIDERNATVGARHPTITSDEPSPPAPGVDIDQAISPDASPLRPAREQRPDTSEPIRIRIGINAGEPIAEGDDLFGASVIATARICAQASGGQILASDVVRQLLAGKGFTFTDQGEHSLKGFDDPVRLHEARWRE